MSSITYTPRLQSLLQSNESLHESELAQIRLREKDLAREHHDVQTAIASLQKQMNALADRLSVLQPRLGSARNIIGSPCRRLTDENLREIFQHVVAAKRNSNSSLDITEGPWLMSYVCRRWRRVSLSFPSLWNDVVVTMITKRPLSRKLASSFLWTRSLLRLQLARSGNSPINVKLDCGHIYVGPQNPFVKILVDSTARWRSFHLIATRASIVALLKVVGVSPLLHTACLVQTMPLNMEFPNGDMEPWHCNNIRRFGYSSFPRGTQIPAVSSWNQLQDLFIEDCSHPLSSLLHVLGQTPNLTDLSMVQVTLLPSLSDAPSPFTLSKLQRLTLLSWFKLKPESVYVGLLQSMTAPALYHLKAAVSEINLTPLVQFIQKSGCNLVSFGLEGNSIPFNAKPLLHSIRGIQTLTILRQTNHPNSFYLAAVFETLELDGISSSVNRYDVALAMQTLKLDATDPLQQSEDDGMHVDEAQQQQQLPVFPQLSTLVIDVQVLEYDTFTLSHLLLSRASGIGSNVADGSVQALRRVILAGVSRRPDITDAIRRCRASGMSITCPYVRT